MAKKPKHRSQSIALWPLAIVVVVALSLTLGVYLMNRPTANPTATAHMNMPEHVQPEPDWLKNALKPVRDAYIYAAWNPEPLQYIPCYCGCGNIHGSNAACYFKRDEEGNVLAYDQHAYG